MDTGTTLGRPFYPQEDWESANGSIPTHLFTTEPGRSSFGVDLGTQRSTIKPVDGGSTEMKP